MRMNSAQRDLVLELLQGVGSQVPALLEAWQQAGEEEPPTIATIAPDEFLLFTTVRRLPLDMKPEDGSLRYAMPPPFVGAEQYKVTYFYEPPPPTGFPTLLVVVAWHVPDAAVNPPLATPGDE